MKLWLSLLLTPFVWAAYMAAGLVLYLAGLVLVPLALLCKAYLEQYTIFQKWVTLFTWSIMRPYNNLEDGLCPPEYELKYPNVWPRVRMLMWYLRNPVSGLRWTSYLSLLIKPANIKYVGSYGQAPADRHRYELKLPCWLYIWQGPYSGLWTQFYMPFSGGSLWRFWIGWKIYASDIDATQFGYRAYGAGFAMQFKRVQIGDNRN